MQLSGPFTYQIQFDSKEITNVEAPNGDRKFSGEAYLRVPKLYVVSDNQNHVPVYVGVTKQRMKARLRQGFQPKDSHGYHGYEWRNHLSQASVDIWLCGDEDPATIETVEAEVVFQIRSIYGQWPEYQTEIHFHHSDPIHKKAAEEVISHYRQSTGPGGLSLQSIQENVMQSPTYRAASRELLGQATRELAAGDSRQASEKAWGAAAQMIKAVAQDRGWQHNNHFLLFQTANRLAQETGDRQIVSLLTAASGLHINFYENWLPPESVEVGIRDIEVLLDKLEPLL